jgi:hypothetical protein
MVLFEYCCGLFPYCYELLLHSGLWYDHAHFVTHFSCRINFMLGTKWLDAKTLAE